MNRTTDLAYIAGFVDGEGCIRVADNGSVELTTVNTSLPTLTFIKETIGGVVSDRKQRVNKAQYQHRIYGPDAVKALVDLLPFLKEKKLQAQIAIDWAGRRDSYQAVRTPGVRGAFANPDRKKDLSDVQQQLKDLKRV